MTTIEDLGAATEPKAMTMLVAIGARLEAAGWTIKGPYGMCDDRFCWSMLVNQPGAARDEDDIDVAIEIAEAVSYGDEPADGVNVGAAYHGWGGVLVGAYQPYNFTDQCWVSASDDEAIAERWGLLFNEGVVAHIADFLLHQ